MSSNNKLLAEKYRPNNLSEVILPEDILKRLLRFIVNFAELMAGNINLSQFKGKKGILLIGNPGTGKTTLAYALAKEFNLSVIETNASDTRGKKALETKLENSVASKNLMEYISKSVGKLLLMDEIDGIDGRYEKGGFTALAELMKNSIYPFILTANNKKDQYKELEPYIETIYIPNPSEDDKLKLLKRICKKENIVYKPEDLTIIAKKSEDYRSAINNLIVNVSNKILNSDMILCSRSMIENDINKLKQLYQTKNIDDNILLLNGINSDLREIISIVGENAHTFIKNPKSLEKTLRSVEKADSLYDIMMTEHNFTFIDYIYYILACLGTQKFIKSDIDLKEPSFQKNIPYNNLVLQKLQRIIKLPIDQIYIYVLPLFRQICDRHPEIKEKIFTLTGLSSNNEEYRKIVETNWYKLR